MDDLKVLFEDIEKDSIKEKISDVLDQIKDIVYGFIDKNTGEIHDNRDWIHNCRNLSDYYEVERDPEKTLNNKLGICTDQCLAINHLMKKLHPELKGQLYALIKGRFGHCTYGFSDGNNFYYLENAWDKMKENNQPTIYGPFDSEDKLIDFFEKIYHKFHDKDNDCPVIIKHYEEYEKTRKHLNESVYFGFPNFLK